MDKISEASIAITALTSMMHTDGDHSLQDSNIHDTRRFLQTFTHVLTLTPLQVYSSAIMFSPIGGADGRVVLGAARGCPNLKYFVLNMLWSTNSACQARETLQ